MVNVGQYHTWILWETKIAVKQLLWTLWGGLVVFNFSVCWLKHGYSSSHNAQSDNESITVEATNYRDEHLLLFFLLRFSPSSWNPKTYETCKSVGLWHVNLRVIFTSWFWLGGFIGFSWFFESCQKNQHNIQMLVRPLCPKIAAFQIIQYLLVMVHCRRK